MNKHLSEEQITEWALGREWRTCPSPPRGLRRVLSRGGRIAERSGRIFGKPFMPAPNAIRASGETRDSLCANASRHNDSYPLHWGWMVAMVAVLIAAILLARTPNVPKNYPSEDADNALLQAVQGDLNRDVPQALAPAVLIAEERNEILSKRSLTR